MKLIVVLILGSLMLAQAQPAQPAAPGIQVLKIKVREKTVRRSQSPPPLPQINPTLGRGPSDRYSTDSERVAALKDTRDDTYQRMQELQNIGSSTSIGRLPLDGGGGRFVALELQARLKNENSKSITEVIGTYQPPGTSGGVAEITFVCNVSVRPGATADIRFQSRSSSVVNVTRAELRAATSDIAIKYVKYADGSAWESASGGAALAVRNPGKGKCLAF